jgi:hypothetical protein
LVTITDATVRQDVYETVYDLLATEVATSTSPIYQYTLSAAFIDKSMDTPFPQIIVNPVDVESTERTLGHSGRFTQDIRVLIDVWTRKNKDKDIASDRIYALLTATSWSGILLTGITESNAFEEPGSNKAHLKSLALSFLRK